MPGSIDLALALRWITLLGIALTAARLLRAGMYRKYRIFFAYLIFWLLRSGVLLTLNVRSALYAKIWILTEPVLWFFYIFLLLELYSLILQAHKGLYTMGRWALYGALLLAITVSSIIFAAPSRDPFNQSRLIALLLVLERGLLLSLVVFLLLILLFLSRYPISLTRNVIIHSIVYAAFFLSNTLAFLIRSMFGYEVARPVNIFLMGVSAACVLAWLVLLSPAGERRVVRFRLLWNRGEEKHLAGQLETMNAALLRLAGKSNRI